MDTPPWLLWLARVAFPTAFFVGGTLLVIQLLSFFLWLDRLA